MRLFLYTRYSWKFEKPVWDAVQSTTSIPHAIKIFHELLLLYWIAWYDGSSYAAWTRTWQVLLTQPRDAWGMYSIMQRPCSFRLIHNFEKSLNELISMEGLWRYSEWWSQLELSCIRNKTLTFINIDWRACPCPVQVRELYIGSVTHTVWMNRFLATLTSFYCMSRSTVKRNLV